jgi:hypothetical protein
MPRNIDPTVLAQLTGPSITLALFVMITFATSTGYIWSGRGNVLFNGQTWTGVGTFLNVSTIEDGNTIDARGISVTLSGIDTTSLNNVMSEYKLGLPAAVYLGVYSNGTLIDFPSTSWIGRTDQPSLSITGPESTITINCENRLVDMNIPGYRRLTNDDQQMTWPGDLGLSFVSSLLEKQLYWGTVPQFQNTL